MSLSICVLVQREQLYIQRLMHHLDLDMKTRVTVLVFFLDMYRATILKHFDACNKWLMYYAFKPGAEAMV